MAKICLSVDDNAPENIVLAEAFRVYKVPATFFLSAQDVKHGIMNARDQSRLFSMDNLQFGSHTYSHQLLTRIPYEQATKEIQDGKTWLEHHTQKKCDKFVFPRGYKSPELLLQLPKFGIHYVRGVEIMDGGLSYVMHNGKQLVYDRPSVHIYQRKEYGDRMWTSIAEEQLYARSRVHVFMHAWEVMRDEQLQPLLQWIVKKQKEGHKFVHIEETI